MDTEESSQEKSPEVPETTGNPDQHCPVCSATLLHEKCKVVCRSPRCVYRIIFNCAEF
jgi:hypothetical protein